MNAKWIAEISSEIEIKRFEMLQFADDFGMADEHTIRASQELDQLINEYQRLKFSPTEEIIELAM